jgi:hypothetical protein
MARTPPHHAPPKEIESVIRKDQRASYQEFSMLEVGQAVSRALQLPAELAEIIDLTGRMHSFVNQNLELRVSGLDGASFRTLLLSNLTPEVALKLDPAQAARLRAEQEAKANVTGASGGRALGDGYRLLNGVWVRDTNEKSEAALAMRGDKDASRTGAYARELSGKASAADIAPGTGFSWLSPANQNIPGFNQAQVAASANFLKSIGFSREQVNEGTRHMVHLQPYKSEITDFAARWRDINRRRALGENVDEDVKKIEDEQNKTRERMTPAQRKHFDKVIPIIRQQEKSKVELQGDEAVGFGEDHEQRVLANKEAGIAQRIEADHDKTVTRAQANPTAGDDIAARLARRAAQRQQAEAAASAGDTTAPARPGTIATPLVKSAETQKAGDGKPLASTVAANSKALQPTIG